MNRRLLHLLLVLVVAVQVTSCKSCKDPNDVSQDLFVPDSIKSAEVTPVLGKAVMDEMMQNIHAVRPP